MERGTALALDASAMLNLLATGCLPEILTAAGAKFVAVGPAIAEVRTHPIDRSNDPMTPFLARRLPAPAALSPVGLETFISLVSAKAPDDLGDGEAATIAHAHDEGLGIVLDDRKARRICAVRYPALHVVSSVELFRLAEVEAALGAARFRKAVFDALRLARMRVLAADDPWIRTLLDEAEIAQCPSLRRRLK